MVARLAPFFRLLVSGDSLHEFRTRGISCHRFLVHPMDRNGSPCRKHKLCLFWILAMHCLMWRNCRVTALSNQEEKFWVVLRSCDHSHFPALLLDLSHVVGSSLHSVPKSCSNRCGGLLLCTPSRLRFPQNVGGAKSVFGWVVALGKGCSLILLVGIANSVSFFLGSFAAIALS